jgi:hypothetical protein
MNPEQWTATDYERVGTCSLPLATNQRSEMRSVHFRVEDDLYTRIHEEAQQQDLSVASFARVATVARTILWAVRRGAPWADLEAWGEAVKIIEEIERRDIAARAKLATERRTGRTFREKLEREQQQAVKDRE